MTDTHRRIAAVATGQLGLLSRQQANGVGLTNAQLRSRVTSGSLLKVGIDTFRLPGAPASALADLRALMLDVGGDVVASGLGYRYHRTPPQLRRDAERMNAMVADGLRPYQFSYEQVVDAPGEVVAQTRTALAARAE